MTTLYALPYNIDATGFYFDSAEDYAAKAKGNYDRYGQFVEEYEVQFIDGEAIDCELAKAIGLSQCNFSKFFDLIDEWDEGQKVRFIIAVGEGGYSFDLDAGDIDALDIDIYEEDTMRDLTEQFVDDGLFGDIPERLQYYIDYDAIARDLAVEYATTNIAGTRLIYRLG
jgi:hypothetical protein